jgi:zinc ribbon protein
MAIACARCGAQNPDANQFCQACGTPLIVPAAGVAPAGPPPPPAAPPPGPPQAPAQAPAASWQVVAQQPAPEVSWAPAGPPPGMAPPMGAPTSYQSPYYDPTGVQIPVHRTPWTMIVAGVVALIVVMGGFGTALALMGNHDNSQNGGLSTVPSPSSSPSPTANGTATVSNIGETVPVPAGWTVVSKDATSVSLEDPTHSGDVTVASGPSSPAQTAQQDMVTIDRALQKKYPDTRVCPGTNISTSTFNGAPGIFYTLCMTLTSGNQSLRAVASMFAGANADGSVFYLVMMITEEGNLQGFTAVARPVLLGIHWKLS